MKIDDIIPYKNNARHNEKAVPVVAESIKEFGLKGQIVLESHDNPVIVAGHTRWEACKSLGWTEIPDERIDYCEDLTEEQIKAYRLADNKTAEVSTWNTALLKNEIRELKEFDMGKFNFDFKSKNLPYGEARLNTDRGYNLQLLNRDDCDGKYGMPTLEPCDFVPCDLLPFNCAKTFKEYNKGVHFFIDDYMFERIWTNPEKYIEQLEPYTCVLTPDFSLYLDMPLPMQMWNVYRSRAIGHMYQEAGLKVIPTIQYSDESTYDFAFEGLPSGGTLATSTIGVKRSKESRQLWEQGMKECLKRVKPKTLLLYGGRFDDLDYGNIKVVEMKANTGFRK